MVTSKIVHYKLCTVAVACCWSACGDFIKEQERWTTPLIIFTVCMGAGSMLILLESILKLTIKNIIEKVW